MLLIYTIVCFVAMTESLTLVYVAHSPLESGKDRSMMVASVLQRWKVLWMCVEREGEREGERERVCNNAF